MQSTDKDPMLARVLMYLFILKMLWWKHLESGQENVMICKMEEERRREYIENTTVTLTLPSIHPVMQENLFITNLEHVKSLQASLFPICNKGNVNSFNKAFPFRKVKT